MCSDVPVGAQRRRRVWPCIILWSFRHHDGFSFPTFAVSRRSPPSQRVLDTFEMLTAASAYWWFTVLCFLGNFVYSCELSLLPLPLLLLLLQAVILVLVQCIWICHGCVMVLASLDVRHQMLQKLWLSFSVCFLLFASKDCYVSCCQRVEIIYLPFFVHFYIRALVEWLLFIVCGVHLQ